MTERFDAEDRDWPARPWILAAKQWDSPPGVTAEVDGTKVNLPAAKVELRTVERKQLYIDGQPVGEDME